MESVQVPANALVLVSDGRRARLMRNQGTPVNPKLVVERDISRENPPTHEQGTDKPGRRYGATVNGQGVFRGAIEQTDYHQQQEERFAAELAEILYKLEHAGRFNDLVVVAPPKMLGDLRAKLHPKVAGAVVGELPKDLTMYSPPEIGQMLS
jgi:protein required for attachment to host cells